MPSDAKVPDPLPRGLTVPAGAVVVLVLLGAGWGVGMFLLGRQSAPAPEPTGSSATGHLGWLNRLDQTIAQGDLDDALAQLATPQVPDGPLGQTAVELRRVRVAALAAERAAAQEAASPAAVLRRLHASLWSLDPSRLATILPPHPELPPPAGPPTPPAVEAGATAHPAAPAGEPRPAPAPLAEEKLDGQPFIPLARISHPSLPKRAYAIHPTRGLVRSDDGGVTWRSGLEPLTRVTGARLVFSQGGSPLLIVVGEPLWVFADGPDAYFP